MEEDQIKEIVVSAQHKLFSLESLHKKLIQHLAISDTDNRPPATLIVNDEYMEIDWFGLTARATPRIVKASNNNFQMEYAFFIDKFDTKIKVFCFFLRPSHGEHAELTLDPKGTEQFCTNTNRYARIRLTYLLLYGILQSNFYPDLSIVDEPMPTLGL